jgi:hypothetical protein
VYVVEAAEAENADAAYEERAGIGESELVFTLTSVVSVILIAAGEGFGDEVSEAVTDLDSRESVKVPPGATLMFADFSVTDTLAGLVVIVFE